MSMTASLPWLRHKNPIALQQVNVYNNNEQCMLFCLLLLNYKMQF